MQHCCYGFRSKLPISNNHAIPDSHHLIRFHDTASSLMQSTLKNMEQNGVPSADHWVETLGRTYTIEEQKHMYFTLSLLP